jgi:hypothetical protein
VKHSVVYIKWDDACEGEDMGETEMAQCIQEVVGFLVKKSKGNYYIARDYNTLVNEYQKVIRIPEQYIINIIRKTNA